MVVVGVLPPLPPFAITKAVVAILVELSPEAGVGAIGVPVNSGEADGALLLRTVLRSVCAES